MKLIYAALLSCVLLGGCTAVPEVGHDQKRIDNGYRHDYDSDHEINHNSGCQNMNTQGHC